MTFHRTPAGGGLILAVVIVLAMLVLHYTASPCELPDGNLAANCTE
mgnify:CR=1 FL=1